VTMKSAVFWDVTPCGSCIKSCELLVTAKVAPSSLIVSIQLMFLRSVLQLPVTANVVPSLLIVSI
jgi:hypothetical protein